MFFLLPSRTEFIPFLMIKVQPLVTWIGLKGVQNMNTPRLIP